jgi:hypothetical protein
VTSLGSALYQSGTVVNVSRPFSAVTPEGIEYDAVAANDASSFWIFAFSDTALASAAAVKEAISAVT